MGKPPMSEPFQELANLDRVVHEGSRLAIMTALSVCESADFLYLSRLTGLTAGNLSTHLTKLADAELIKVQKQFVGKKPNTLVSITAKGRAVIEAHWKSLELLRSQAREWKPPRDKAK